MKFSKGIQDGIPIALGYLAVSFSFGIAGSDFLTWPLVTLISMTNLTSAGQFAGLQIMEAAGSFLEILIATFFINLRYSLMAISLSQKVNGNFNIGKRLLLSTGITDEIYALAMAQSGKIGASYFAGLMCLPYCGWALGTLGGAACGAVLPAVLTNALGVALYGMFVAIVVPEMQKYRSITIAVLISIGCSFAFRYIPALNKISVGFAIILCAVLASAIAAVLFPIREKENACET